MPNDGRIVQQTADSRLIIVVPTDASAAMRVPRIREWARQHLERLGSIALIVAAGVAAIGGYRWRALLLRSDRGVGYTLGIVGGAMMIVLLVYPVRKRWMYDIPGSISFWFRFHIILGLLGPLAVLFHARFTYNAPNSGIALGAMLTVVGSGLVGRYLHLHLYRGYALKHVEAAACSEAIVTARRDLGTHAQNADIEAEITALAARVREVRETFLATIGSALALRWTTMLRRPVLRRLVRQELAQIAIARSWTPKMLRREQRASAHAVSTFFDTLNTACGLAAFERAFALWHNLHLPLIGLLIVAAIVHVVAVHLY